MQKTLEIFVKLLSPEKIPELEKFLMERPDIGDIRIKDKDCIGFTLSQDMAAIPKLVSEISSAGFPVIEFKPQMLTMEDVFIQITEGEF